jgi:hypothetical protein
MEKTFQYQQQIFAGLELEIYNDLLKNDEIFLQCTYKQHTNNPQRIFTHTLAASYSIPTGHSIED